MVMVILLAIIFEMSILTFREKRIAKTRAPGEIREKKRFTLAPYYLRQKRFAQICQDEFSVRSESRPLLCDIFRRPFAQGAQDKFVGKGESPLPLGFSRLY